MDAQCYTWQQFQAAVTALLPEDAARMNVAQLIPLWIQLAVIDLQTFIPGYRNGHETLFSGNDFVGEGFASRGAQPPQAIFKECFLIQYIQPQVCVSPPLPGQPPATPPPLPQMQCRRLPLLPYDYEQRMDLVHGHVPVVGAGYVSVGREALDFYVYPCVRDGQQVSIFWNCIRSQWNNPLELTPFDTAMTDVVASFVKAKVAMRVDRDLPMEQDYTQKYMAGRTSLFLTMRERRGSL